jgi:Tfp pilus assembly protein PilE
VILIFAILLWAAVYIYWRHVLNVKMDEIQARLAEQRASNAQYFDKPSPSSSVYNIKI